MDPSALTQPVPPPPVLPAVPGEGARILELLTQFEASLGDWAGALFQLDEASLTQVMGAMLRVAVRAENVAALATADAVTRGTVANSTATGAPGWVVAHTAGIDPAVARRVGSVGQDCASPKNQVIARALAAGTASVPAAVVALREVPPILHQLPSAGREEILLRYLSLSPYGPRALRELSTRIRGQYAPELLVREEDAQQQCEQVRWYELPGTGGLTRFEADLSAARAATVKHALQALSAPAPKACPGTRAPTTNDETGNVDAGDDTEPDLRTPGKRRADALVRLVETAAGALDGTASRPVGEVGGTAKLLITLDYQTLYAGLQASGTITTDGNVDPAYLPGVGYTSDGDYLDAGTLRRLACDADLIPLVLGGESEPLDVGRGKRLFTGGLRTAIIHRDKGCTFPGCDRPPQWCDAHHITPWWAGGETTQSNAALLCARHHTIVHNDLLTATAAPTGVTWDLTLGLMPTRPDKRDAA